MDFSEALKIPISKSHAPLPGGSIVNGGAGTASGHAVGGTDQGAGYVTEKLYMLLQLYLQNKGWNPSVELLQCFAELKDTPILPSAAYLQALASRVALDNQGRLVLRETGKIVLPYEHFANAVMLKHMSGPHGLHLSIEATVRAVMDSYTIGRDSFGMEKEFIVEVVQSCPSPACRYYKGQLGVGSFIDQPSFGASSGSSTGAGGPPPGGHLNSAEYLTHLQQQLGQQNAGLFELGANERDPSKALMSQVKHSKTTASPQHQQPHINAALFQQQQQQQQQQQSRAIVPPKAPPFDGFSNLSAFDKQRMLQHLQDKQKHFEAAHIAPSSHVVGTGVLGAGVISKQQQQQQQQQAATLLQQHQTQALQSSNASHHHLHHSQQPQQQQQQQQPQQQSPSQPPPVSQQQQHTQPSTIVGPLIPPMMNQPQQQQQQQQQHQQQLAMQAHLSQPPLQTVNMDTGHKLSDYMRGAIDPHECVSTASSELLALHNGAWSQDRGDSVAISQDKIIRAFSELMRNIAKMKTFIRPSMCKPYGKQSESLQKTLFDTIQLLQMLRNCLPAPHIPVSSWKGSELSGSTETALN